MSLNTDHRPGGAAAHSAGRHDLASRLDHYYHLVKTVLLCRQHPVSGLMPASTANNAHGNYNDAWVRDNVYSILAIWGLGLAYRKLDWDQGRTYELEMSVVKTMRGLLLAMMRQAGKVEQFKKTQSPMDALHAKYDTATGNAVVGDGDWGHLQLDATSLWLLMLGQMTASGLSILYTIDEVNFVQNLVYYVGRTYRTPDYGIWERGHKINSGEAELNASSIGMAKAALEALSGLDLFGVRGSQASVLHVMPDEIARARITLESLLPWESSSKEVDSAVLSIVGFPAFASDDADLTERTRRRVVERLQGNYGCKRFLRDGHQTVLEDVGRMNYDPWELAKFEHIESEWPLFYTYLMLDALFRGDAGAVADYRERLKSVLVERDGVALLPELYVVPLERIDAERANPKSQVREPNANVPLVWAQSLYYLALMLDEGLLELGDIDPLGRHLRVGKVRHPVVQVALLAEDEALQHELISQGVLTQTPQQIAPIQVRRAGELAAAYHQIGRNDALGLTGRPVRRLRTLTTSKIFRIQGQLMIFLPSFLDPQKFYLMLDSEYLIGQVKSELAYIQQNWRQKGRPTIALLLTRALLETGQEALLTLIADLNSGNFGGVPVRVGRIGELMHTSGVERIDYLHEFAFASAPMGIAQPAHYRLIADLEKSEPLSPEDAVSIDQETDDAVLQQRLTASRNVFEQVELLQGLARLHGLDFPAKGNLGDESATVQDLLEDVYAQAGRGVAGRSLWSVVRRAAGLCDKTDIALADAVTDILVRQKQITVGKSYSDASVIYRPLPPSEIRAKIREFGGGDVRDRMVTQEVIIYLGLLIRAEPALFEGLMTLRVGYLILLMISDLAEELSIRQEEAHELLMHLRPSEIQTRLRAVLGDYEDKASLMNRQETLPLRQGVVASVPLPVSKITAPVEGWTRYRQREGTLNRVPAGFYPRVWNLLKHCHGLIIGDKLDLRNRLDSARILSETTSGEMNFALWTEHLLNKMDAAKFRQATIEAMVTLADLAERTPELYINDFLVFDVIVGHAVRLAWLDAHPERAECYAEDKASAWAAYYESSPQVCGVFVIKALQFLTG